MEQLFEDFEKKIAASGLDKKTRIKSTIKRKKKKKVPSNRQ